MSEKKLVKKKYNLELFNYEKNCKKTVNIYKKILKL